MISTWVPLPLDGRVRKSHRETNFKSWIETYCMVGGPYENTKHLTFRLNPNYKIGQVKLVYYFHFLLILIFGCLPFWSPFWPIVSAVFFVASIIYQTSHALFMQIKLCLTGLVLFLSCGLHIWKKGHIFILSKHNYYKIPCLFNSLFLVNYKANLKENEKKQIMFNRLITIDDDTNMSQSDLVNIKIFIYIWWFNLLN